MKAMMSTLDIEMAAFRFKAFSSMNVSKILESKAFQLLLIEIFFWATFKRE